MYMYVLYGITFYQPTPNTHPMDSSGQGEGWTPQQYKKIRSPIVIDEDYQRLRILESGLWVMSDVNSQYELCHTYPQTLLFPTLFPAEELHHAAGQRYDLICCIIYCNICYMVCYIGRKEEYLRWCGYIHPLTHLFVVPRSQWYDQYIMLPGFSPV